MGADRDEKSVELPWFFDRLRDRNLVIMEPPGSDRGINTVNIALGQVLATFPPGSVRFLLIDPTGLGDNFRSFTALGDEDADLISGMIWSEQGDIKRELTAILKNVASIRQNLLRGDYANIDQYNKAFEFRTGSSDQPYRFVAIANFPEGFDTETCETLERLMINGPECGVHVLMTWSTMEKLPHGINAQDLQSQAAVVEMGQRVRTKTQPSLTAHGDKILYKLDFVPDGSEELAAISAVVRRHAHGAGNAKSVEYPFQTMIDSLAMDNENTAVDYSTTWSGKSRDFLFIPVGQAGANRIQPLKGRCCFRQANNIGSV